MPAAEQLTIRRAKRPFLRLIPFGVLVAGALIAVLAQPHAELAPGDGAQVLAADAALAGAMHSGDKAIARQLLALQFSYTDAAGAVHPRKEFLADLKNIAAPETDQKVAVYGAVATVTGRSRATQDVDTFALRIWVKQKNAWRVLTMQDVGLGVAAKPNLPAAPAAASECKNPCLSIPYRVRSPAEQEVVNAFQASERAVIAHDADEWGRHVADEFVSYRSGDAPLSKSGRIAAIEDQKKPKTPAVPAAIQSARLWVFGDGAAMISTDGAAEGSQPLQRVARVWVKRNGQWQMALSAQTLIK